MRTYNIKERYGNRLMLVGRIAESRTNVLTDEHKNICVHCGAQLVTDVAFQKLHMEKEHGLRC